MANSQRKHCRARRVHPISTDYYLACDLERGHGEVHSADNGKATWTDGHDWACRDSAGNTIDWRERTCLASIQRKGSSNPNADAQPKGEPPCGRDLGEYGTCALYPNHPGFCTPTLLDAEGNWTDMVDDDPPSHVRTLALKDAYERGRADEREDAVSYLTTNRSSGLWNRGDAQHPLDTIAEALACEKHINTMTNIEEDSLPHD